MNYIFNHNLYSINSSNFKANSSNITLSRGTNSTNATIEEVSNRIKLMCDSKKKSRFI